MLATEVQVLDAAKRDVRVKGVLAALGGRENFEGLAQVQELRDAVADFKAGPRGEGGRRCGRTGRGRCGPGAHAWHPGAHAWQLARGLGGLPHPPAGRSPSDEQPAGHVTILWRAAAMHALSHSNSNSTACAATPSLL